MNDITPTLTLRPCQCGHSACELYGFREGVFLDSNGFLLAHAQEISVGTIYTKISSRPSWAFSKSGSGIPRIRSMTATLRRPSAWHDWPNGRVGDYDHEFARALKDRVQCHAANRAAHDPATPALDAGGAGSTVRGGRADRQSVGTWHAENPGARRTVLYRMDRGDK